MFSLASVSPHHSFAPSSPHVRVSDTSRAPSLYMCSADAQQIPVVLGITKQYGLVEWHGYYDTLRQPKATRASPWLHSYVDLRRFCECVCKHQHCICTQTKYRTHILCATAVLAQPMPLDLSGVFRFCKSNHRIATIIVPTVQRSNCDEMTPSAMIRKFCIGCDRLS